MTSAARDEILLSGHAHKAVANEFAFEPRPPMPMKGKAEPLPVFAVTGARQQRAIRLQEPTYALPMGIVEHDFDEVGGAGCRDDGAAKAVFHQFGHEPGVIDMGMSKERDSRAVSGVNGKGALLIASA